MKEKRTVKLQIVIEIDMDYYQNKMDNPVTTIREALEPIVGFKPDVNSIHFFFEKECSTCHQIIK